MCLLPRCAVGDLRSDGSQSHILPSLTLFGIFLLAALTLAATCWQNLAQQEKEGCGTTCVCPKRAPPIRQCMYRPANACTDQPNVCTDDFASAYTKKSERDRERAREAENRVRERKEEEREGETISLLKCTIEHGSMENATASQLLMKKISLTLSQSHLRLRT